MQKKIKLIPSLREKRHYLVLELKIKNKEKVAKIIDKAILSFIGQFGYAKAGPMVVKLKQNNSCYCILSVNRKQVDLVKTALSFAKVKCLGISGTIRKAEAHFLKGKI